uniref:Uncharacterized protein n=1 Tax=Moniliophthora roreri TaxID=221103 RepID=A0A0W0F977_MONRR
MSLRLHSSEDPYYPLITSPNKGDELGFGEATSSSKPFAIYNEKEFFAAATAWIGPLQRLGDKAVTLFYAVIAHTALATSGGANIDIERKYLSITILLTDSRSFTFLCCTHDAELMDVFSSKLEIVSATESYQAVLGARVQSGNDGFLRSQLFRDVVRHAQHLSVRLFGIRQTNLHLKWNLPGSQLPRNDEGQLSAHGAQLSITDNEYINLQELWDLKSVYLESCYHAQNNGATAKLRTSFHHDVLNIITSTLFELYLWTRECCFLDDRREDKRLIVQRESIYAVQMRIAAEKHNALLRYEAHKWEVPTDETEPLETQMRKAWDNLQGMLRRLRMCTGSENDDLNLLAKGFWERIGGGVDVESITDLCAQVLPPSILRVLDHGDGDEEIQEELHHSLLLLKSLANAPNPQLSVPYVHVEEASDFTLTGIRTNKRLWFEGRGGHEVEAKGNSIKLYNRARCLVLFRCPSPGALMLMLSVREIDGDSMELSATLKLDRRADTYTTKYTVSRSNNQKAVPVVFDFSDVPAGCGEIQIMRIRGDKRGVTRAEWEIHGLVDVQWRGKELGRGSSGMRAMENVNGGKVEEQAAIEPKDSNNGGAVVEPEQRRD